MTSSERARRKTPRLRRRIIHGSPPPRLDTLERRLAVAPDDTLAAFARADLLRTLGHERDASRAYGEIAVRAGASRDRRHGKHSSGVDQRRAHLRDRAVSFLAAATVLLALVAATAVATRRASPPIGKDSSTADGNDPAKFTGGPGADLSILRWLVLQQLYGIERQLPRSDLDATVSSDGADGSEPDIERRLRRLGHAPAPAEPSEDADQRGRDRRDDAQSSSAGAQAAPSVGCAAEEVICRAEDIPSAPGVLRVELSRVASSYWGVVDKGNNCKALAAAIDRFRDIAGWRRNREEAFYKGHAERRVSECFWRVKDFDGAMEYARRAACSHDRREAVSYCVMADAADSKGRAAQARRLTACAEEAAEANSGVLHGWASAEDYYRVGERFLKLADIDGALRALRQARRIVTRWNPSDAEKEALKGRVLRKIDVAMLDAYACSGATDAQVRRAKEDLLNNPHAQDVTLTIMGAALVTRAVKAGDYSVAAKEMSLMLRRYEQIDGIFREDWSGRRRCIETDTFPGADARRAPLLALLDALDGNRTPEKRAKLAAVEAWIKERAR